MTNPADMNIGQLLVVGFHGTRLTDALDRALREGRVGGVILFSRNLESPEQITALTRSIHEAAAEYGTPPFVAIDQEGGKVQRIRAPLPHWPDMRTVGDTRDADLAAKVGEYMADEVAEFGFNLNFAPCADVDSNPANPIIGRRAFSDEAQDVARFAGAYGAGMTIAGVVPCMKHFPGHGDTAVDSHLALPTVSRTRAELDAVEFAPFRALIKAGIPMLMTAHIIFEALDPEIPATMSEKIIGELLRVEMGYDGVVVSDDLEMKAVADNYTLDETLIQSLRAGVDMFLICSDEERWLSAHDIISEHVQRDPLLKARVLAATRRIRRLKSTWLPTTPPDIATDPTSRLNLVEHFELRDTLLDLSEDQLS